MYYGGTKQETKEQRSRKIGKEQEKWEKTTLQSKRVCKKKDLISSKERSQPSKFLAFISRQMHQIKQWGTNLQTSNNSRTIWGITHWIPNKQKTKDHNSEAMEQWSRRWSTDSPHLSHIFYKGCLLLRSYLRKQTKKRKPSVEELSIAISFSMGRKQQ